MSRHRPKPCTICADIKHLAKAVRVAEKRLDASDPTCPCHNYRRSFCIADATRAWWTLERQAEQKAAKEALESARTAFQDAIADLMAVV